jgi:hypothetical protein
MVGSTVDLSRKEVLDTFLSNHSLNARLVSLGRDQALRRRFHSLQESLPHPRIARIVLVHPYIAQSGRASHNHKLIQKYSEFCPYMEVASAMSLDER